MTDWLNECMNKKQPANTEKKIFNDDEQKRFWNPEKKIEKERRKSI